MNWLNNATEEEIRKTIQGLKTLPKYTNNTNRTILKKLLNNKIEFRIAPYKPRGWCLDAVK